MKTDKIKELLERGVSEIIDRDDLEKKLKSGKKLRIKLGIDPTSPNLHLGRSVPLLKLKDFQDLGHKVIFIIGDFTGVIGDTSDKESERPMLSEKQIKENIKTYKKQASKIINLKKAEVYFNSKWLKKLNYKEIGFQADQFSINEFISRDNIKRRLQAGKRVSLREVLYPLMQGYDSVAVSADVEIGGTDQRFNLLSGRDIQKIYKQEPQNIITGPLVAGLDGKKMSSSAGNTINLLDEPSDMFGKVMSMKDDFIIDYFTLFTRIDMEKIDQYDKDIKNGLNPRDIKLKLAYEIVSMYHSVKEAEQAMGDFNNTFSGQSFPNQAPVLKANRGEKLIDVLNNPTLSLSKTELRRLFKDGAVYDMDNYKKITDSYLSVDNNLKLKIGKKKFLKIEVV